VRYSLSIKDIGKFPLYSEEAEGGATGAGTRLNLDEYLRQGLGKTDGAQAEAPFWSAWERLDNPPNSNLPASSMATPHAQEGEGAWRENFATRLNESELRKGLSLSRYVAVAFLVCSVSGGVFFYFLTHYAAFDARRGSMASLSRAAAALDYSARPSDPELPAPSGTDDANADGRLPPGPSGESTVDSSSVPGSSGAASEAERNQGMPVESFAAQPAAAQEPPRGVQASETNSPPASSSSKAASADETAGTPPGQHTYRTASLTPPPGISVLDTAIPGAGYAPNEKPAAAKNEKAEKSAAANRKSDRSAAVPDVHLASLMPAQEAKMLARASELMNENDIAGARLVYEYLANHSSAAGAFALAESYDARKLARYRITGMMPDAGLAQVWYQRAAALGSKEAAAILREDKH
jgi:hypothetical protein